MQFTQKQTFFKNEKERKKTQETWVLAGFHVMKYKQLVYKHLQCILQIYACIHMHVTMLLRKMSFSLRLCVVYHSTERESLFYQKINTKHKSVLE